MTEQGSSQDGARGSCALMGFVIGAAVGAGLALLLAPASGEETRRRLVRTARRVGTSVRDGVDHARGRLSEMKEDVTGRLDGLKEDVHSAVAAGREAYTRERDARLDSPNKS